MQGFKELLRNGVHLPEFNPAKRQALKDIAKGAGMFVVAPSLLVGCDLTPPRPPQLRPVFPPDGETIQDKEMNLREAFILSSGIQVFIYSDSNNLIVDRDDFEAAFDAIFSVLDLQENSRYKEALMRVSEERATGKFSGREIHTYVASWQDACLDLFYNFRTTTEESTQNLLSRCLGAGYHYVIPETNEERFRGETREARRIKILVASGAINGQRIETSIRGHQFTLTAEEALGRNLSHEAAHSYLRLAGIPLENRVGQPGLGQEHTLIYNADHDLLRLYQDGTLTIPIPFRFKE